MDLHTITSSGFEEKLKCFSCKNYLSYFPISLCSNNQNICGRCTEPEETESYQNEAFEAVCQFLKFPCRYQSQGCPEELLPENVPQHEQICAYRSVGCIVANSSCCNWIGAFADLSSHCKEEHADLILEDGTFEMSISSSHKMEYLIQKNENLLILSSKFDRDAKFWEYGVYCHQYQSDYKRSPCQVKVESGDVIVLQNFQTSTFNRKKFTKLSFAQFIETDDEDENVIVDITINIGKLSYKEDDKKYNKLISKISSCVKCSVCSKILYGHVCHRRYTCRGTIELLCRACCRSAPYLSKSVFVTNLKTVFSTLPIYPCSYQNKGCTYISTNDIRLYHEEQCGYKTTQCPFYGVDQCTWEGLAKDVDSHILDQHQNLLLESHEDLSLIHLDKSINYRLVKFSNYLFRLSYCLAEDNFFKWSLQAIAHGGERPKYEIEIADGMKRGRKLITRMFCSSLTEQSDIFKNPAECCCFHMNQVYGFGQYYFGRVLETQVITTFKVRTVTEKDSHNFSSLY